MKPYLAEVELEDGYAFIYVYPETRKRWLHNIENRIYILEVNANCDWYSPGDWGWLLARNIISVKDHHPRTLIKAEKNIKRLKTKYKAPMVP